MKVVLDTNVLIVSIGKNSKYRWLFDSLLEKEFQLLITNDILTEFEEIITQKTDATVANNIIQMLLIRSNVIKIDVSYKWNLIDADKEDNKFVDCAVAGSADYLVTEDKHFNTLKTIDFPFVRVISIAEFKEIIENI